MTCFDAQNGKVVWQTIVGGWRSGGILVKDGVVYVGIGRSLIQALDESTGELMLQYAGLLSTSWKGPPQAFSVADRRIFIEQDGCNAYYIASGEELWKSNPPSMLNPVNIPYTEHIWSFEGKLTLGRGIYYSGDGVKMGIYCVDPDKGTVQWGIEGDTHNAPLTYQNKVILSNFGGRNQPQERIIALTISSGVKAWSFNLGATIYEPLIVGDQLLFAAKNGYFYALNISNGTLAWQTQLNNGFPSETGVSPVVVDTENKEIYWAAGTTSQIGSTSNFTYEGTLYRMDLETGQNLTKTQVRGTGEGGLLTQNNPILGVAILKNTVFLTIKNDVWVVNRTNLSTIKTDHFDHSLLQPIAAYGHVYVSADLYALAYKDIGN